MIKLQNEQEVMDGPQSALAYAEACRMFLDTLRTAAVLSRAQDATEAEKKQFLKLAEATLDRALIELTPMMKAKPYENTTIQ